jgi:hypothetical protein
MGKVRPDESRTKFRHDVGSRNLDVSRLRRRPAVRRFECSGSGKCRLRTFPELFVSAPHYRQPQIAGKRGGADEPRRAGRPLDLAEGRAGTGRRQARADPARVRAAAEVLRPGGPVSARSHRAGRRRGRVRRPPGRRASIRPRVLRMVRKHDRVPPVSDPPTPGVPGMQCRGRRQAHRVAGRQRLPGRAARRPGPGGVAGTVQSRADRAAVRGPVRPDHPLGSAPGRAGIDGAGGRAARPGRQRAPGHAGGGRRR